MFKQLFIFFVLFCSFCAFADTPKVLLGEKLFNDSRFSKTQTISCSSCHMIDESFELNGMRGYANFQARTNLDIIVDGQLTTNRNTQALIGIGSKYLIHDFAHHDGELTHSQTYLGNFTGSNMGWSKAEKKTAISNLVHTIRNDKGDLAEGDFSYEVLFLGIDPAIPSELKLPEDQRVDIRSLTDKELIEKIIEFGTAYLFNIDFEVDEQGDYIGSSYDKFLLTNNIDRGPKGNESQLGYTRRLIKQISSLISPKFIHEVFFETHQRKFRFQEQELRGLKVFLGKGKCINCHTAPLFTDQLFHNVGVTQKEYDSMYGEGSFLKLTIPSLSKRKELYSFEKDLGVWNFFAKAGHEKLTKFVRASFCSDLNNCQNSELLTSMVARFKTPTLRNLGMSNPYFHNGASNSIKESVEHYQKFSEMIRQNKVKNPAPQMRMMRLTDQDVDDLSKFLETLNENYD